MYTKSTTDVLKEFDVLENKGLSIKEVELHKQKYGKNELEKGHRRTVFEMIYEQLKEVMVVILLIAMIISILLNEYIDAGVILLVIIINTTVGVVQESKAERAIEALEKLSSPKALVIREGAHHEIEANQITVGDIVILEAGRLVPCDLRLLTSINLKIDESALTGESEPSEKEATLTLEKNTGIGDRKNMAYMSSYVVSGRGSGLCVAVGMQSEIGKIASMLNEAKEEKTPLQEKLSHLGGLLGYLCVGICASMLVVSLLQKRPFIEMLLTSISLAVAAIPEGLSAIISIVLALGVQRMSKRNAIVRKLVAVETLGCVSVICSDKTGTLTQNKMKVVSTYCDGEFSKASALLIQGMVLCNDVYEDDTTLIGDPTEVALVEYGLEKGFDKKRLEQRFVRVDEIPFDSTRKRMCSVHTYSNGKIVFVKGALDVLLPLCNRKLVGENVYTMNSKDRDTIIKESVVCAENAQRVLALAYKKEINGKNYEQDLVFVGFVGMIDPPREEVFAAIDSCKSAGIKVVMITGDHPTTATAIAKELGIIKDSREVLRGDEIDAMSDMELEHKIMKYSVYARVSPNHKVRLVKAYKSLGHIVAMSGDGVNDAPSLKHADIGIAMGKNGSDVTKSASDIILSDDNFATIVAAVEEGRNIYLNIQKTVLFLLSCNIGEVVTLFLAIIFLQGYPIPLTPIQILWVNLVTDSFPSLALGIDPNQKGVMEMAPRKREESLFGTFGWIFLILNGLLIGTISLVAYRYGLNYSTEVARTMTFMVLSISQLFHALNLMNVNKSIFEVGLFHNPYLIFTVLLGVCIQILVTSIPFFQIVLKTVSLSLSQWGIVFGLSLLVIVVNEISKRIQ